MCLFLLLTLSIIVVDETRPIASEKLFKEWSTVLAPVPVEGRLKNILFFFDPRPNGSFVNFTDEKLDYRFIRYSDLSGMITSEDWFKWMLHPLANPLANAETKPTAYSLQPAA